jgi:hypothetical protein
MAGIVGSAVAGEAVRRLSSLLSGEEGRDHETTEIKVDRVEMAVLKLETVVAMSEDWQITHAPLLRWRAKLKRAVKEGKAILRAHRRNTLRSNMSNSFPRRMARVAKRFMPFSSGNTAAADDADLTDSTARRFERIADGANGFFEFVRHGSRPRVLMFVPSFARSLAPGEATELSFRMEGGTAVMLLRPWWVKIGGGGDGTQAVVFLWISYEHDLASERNLKVIAAFRTSEAVDAMRVAANCAVLLPPQFEAFCAAAMKELVAGMASHGRNSPTASAMYGSLVRAVQDRVTSHDTTPD